MKTIFVFTVSLLIGFTSLSAQRIKESDVPQLVKDAFKIKFPGVVVKEWEMESGSYEAEFVLNSAEASVCFDASGNWIQTETEINPGELPVPVMEYLGKNYKGKTITEASKIIRANGKELYEIEFGDKEILLDANGNPAK